MSEKSKESKTFDPFDPWRALRDDHMEAWSKAMIQAVNSEEYAKSAGAMLDSYLDASAPLRQALEQALARPLEHLNLPMRADIISLAERLTNIEKRLDDLDAKLDHVLHRVPRPAPSRARKKTTSRSRR